MNNDIQLWRMRWFLIIVISACLFASIGIAIVIVVITKSLLTLAIPTPLVVMMRPVVKFLFPPEKSGERHTRNLKKPGMSP